MASGAEPPAWSEVHTFRAPSGPAHSLPGRSAPGETIVDIFGDMGVYGWNCMANMEADLDANRLDAIIHMGDHACSPWPQIRGGGGEGPGGRGQAAGGRRSF